MKLAFDTCMKFTGAEDPERGTKRESRLNVSRPVPIVKYPFHGDQTVRATTAPDASGFFFPVTVQKRDR
jgi:hypothetical protein